MSVGVNHVILSSTGVFDECAAFTPEMWADDIILAYKDAMFLWTKGLHDMKDTLPVGG